MELARRKWSYTRVAEHTGLTRQHVSDIVRGEAGVLSEAWRRILEALDLELAVVPKGAFKPPQPAPAQPPTAEW